ncbi:MAG TPA: peroxide stress protein YaaA [Stackebrandtia sp.]|jgi:cytoplasmic iron level regulating protein YaaA (DUF328/UPF0246 family)|uniref:YaaA family protein n=1 Tax=Stackebrandtia sp. TaxID=2023065 RepID=UPI002D6839B7|nr:peroxide stress protein YaaA [Stackebrandtia sp.]HZE37653.1 peroxide stress protein YaaA [Stackebrandtia sp.]
MRILLPPSEGKTAPSHGDPTDVDALFAPELAAARRRVATSLGRLSRMDPDRAVRVLKLGKKLHHYLDVNARLMKAPAAPAASVYSGVLYDALRLGELDPHARDRARRRLLVFSGLWGVLGIDDPIPDYRCPAGASLPGLHKTKTLALTTFWRTHLDKRLPAHVDGEFILDLRSQDYRAMWEPPGASATVSVFHEQTAGGETTRSVVNHFNKATKGRMVADLLGDGGEPASVTELIEALRDLKYRVEQTGDPRRLDIVVTQL